MLHGANFQERSYTLTDQYNKAMTIMRRLGKPEVGTTTKETVYSEDKLRLYHYAATSPQRVKTPLLIVYALVNRYYITDLDEKRSMIRKMLNQGIDLYLIDWGYADPADRYLDLEDYIQGYIDNCVDQVRQRSNSNTINLLGICQGGTMSCCYSSLNPAKMKNLITMVAPFDFHTEGNTLSTMVQDIDAHQVYQAVGNIKGAWLNQNFSALNPVSLHVIKHLNAIDALQEEESAAFFLRMERWIQDSPDQAGAAFCEFIHKFYQGNQLAQGKLKIGGQSVDPKKITQPILNIYGMLDHIVPPAASQALQQLCNSQDYSELTPNTGHIGMYVSSASKDIPSQIVHWLQQRDD